MEAGGKSDVEAHGLSLLAESGQSEQQTDDGLNTEIATKGHYAAGPVFHERKSIKRAQEDPPRSICCRGWRMDDYLRECRQKKIVAGGFRLLSWWGLFSLSDCVRPSLRARARQRRKRATALRSSFATRFPRVAAKGKAKASPKKEAKAGKKAAKPAHAKEASTPRAESKGAKILELIGRPKGTTLAEIGKATDWQKHSIRGFLSTAAKKHGLKIESTKTEVGYRVYQITK
jgi:uncharacterized protein DUF3489